MCREYVDEVVTVSEGEIASAILTVLEKQKLVAEGAGAVYLLPHRKTACDHRVLDGGGVAGGRAVDVTDVGGAAAHKVQDGTERLTGDLCHLPEAQTQQGAGAYDQTAVTVTGNTGLELVDLRTPNGWSSRDIRIAYDPQTGMLSAHLENEDAAVGTQSISLLPVVRRTDTGEDTVLRGNPVKVTVQVYSAKPSVSVSAKGNPKCQDLHNWRITPPVKLTGCNTSRCLSRALFPGL